MGAYLHVDPIQKALPMRLQTSSESFHHYLWWAQKATFRAADLSKDADLDTLLKHDSRDVIARLCHDALFKGNARVGGRQRIPLITALALLSRNTGNEWLRIQGRERMKERLKLVLDLLPTMQEKIEAEVEARLIIGNREYFVVVSTPSGNELCGVVRIALTA